MPTDSESTAILLEPLTFAERRTMKVMTAKRLIYIVAIIAITMWCTKSAIAQPAPPSYTVSQVAPPPNNDNVSYPVLQINNSGQIMWDLNGLYRLDGTSWTHVGDNTTNGIAMNNAGDIVGRTLISIGGSQYNHAFLFAGNYLYDIGTMSNGDDSYAVALNDSDEVIGWSYTNGDAGQGAFYWKSGTFVPISPLPFPYNNSAGAVSINNAGQVVAISASGDSENHNHMFIWTKDGVSKDIGTPPPPFDYGIPQAISASGSVVGYANENATGKQHPFYYNGMSIVDIGTLGGDFSRAVAINRSEQIVGFSTTASGSGAAFLYQNGTMYDLNNLIPVNSGWKLIEAICINDTGQIVGDGTYQGQPCVFLLTPTSVFAHEKVLTLTTIDVGSTTPRKVDGIVCDNLACTPDSAKDAITVTLGAELINASIDWNHTSVTNADGTMVDSSGHRNTGYVAPGPTSNTIVYYPPLELNREQGPQSPTDVTSSATRLVFLNVALVKDALSLTVNAQPIVLARPPVVLVHGINSDPSKWVPLQVGVQLSLGIRVPFAFVDHSDILGGNGPVELAAGRLKRTIDATVLGIQTGQPLANGSVTQQVLIFPNAPPVVTYTQSPFTDYSGYSVPGLQLACRRADVVGWSYGGVVARWLIASDGTNPSNYGSPGASWYKRIYDNPVNILPAYNDSIRKLFTLGSMWRGVPLVNYVNEVQFNGYLSSSGVYLGDAPVDAGVLESIGWPSTSLGNLHDVVNYISANYGLPTSVPSMEVMAVNSPWQSYLTFHDPFQAHGSLLSAQPFVQTVAYGSVGGDNEAYLGHLLAPYAVLNEVQQPSWFSYLPLEHVPGASRNLSDGLVPLWSSLIPASNFITKVNHSDYPSDSGTQTYIATEINDAFLLSGEILNRLWSTSVQSYDRTTTWTFQANMMAPLAETFLYPQIGGIGRVNPIAIRGTNNTKPVITFSRVGAPILGSDLQFDLAVSNSGLPAFNTTVTAITFYQSSAGPRLPYAAASLPVIPFLGPAQNLTVTVSSTIGFVAIPLFCTVAFQYVDGNGKTTTGSSPPIRLR